MLYKQKTFLPFIIYFIKKITLLVLEVLQRAIAVNKIGKINSKILNKYVDKCVLVKEKKIEEAISLFLMKDKTLVEGAGAQV